MQRCKTGVQRIPRRPRARLRPEDAIKDFRKELAAFKRQLPELLREHPGLYAAIYGGKVIGVDADQFRLARQVEKALPDRFVLIRRIAQNEPEDVFMETPEVCER